MRLTRSLRTLLSVGHGSATVPVETINYCTAVLPVRQHSLPPLELQSSQTEVTLRSVQWEDRDWEPSEASQEGNDHGADVDTGDVEATNLGADGLTNALPQYSSTGPLDFVPTPGLGEAELHHSSAYGDATYQTNTPPGPSRLSSDDDLPSLPEDEISELSPFGRAFDQIPGDGATVDPNGPLTPIPESASSSDPYHGQQQQASTTELLNTGESSRDMPRRFCCLFHDFTDEGNDKFPNCKTEWAFLSQLE
jgi:hypothetical protein